MSKKWAIVTGGTGGLGTDICKSLCKENFNVIAVHHPSDNVSVWAENQKKDGFDIHTLGVDVSRWESCAGMGADIEKQYGNISVIVNNAGIIRDSFLKSMDHKDWDAVLQTNLNSMFYVIRPFIQKMIDNKYGRIVNIASVNGHKGQMGQTNYSAAKAGVYGLTKSLALETAKFGITVNSISPGYTNTALVQSIREDVRQTIINSIPAKRLAEPWEIARAVTFLTHENSGYITGADLSINGGLYMH